MSKERKIEYETTTPVEGEYKEHALSALGKFQKFHEERRESMSDIDKIIDERTFNYYFDEETIVVLDEKMIPKEDGTLSFTPNVRQHIGKVGIVKRCYSDLHAFGRGYSYQIDVEFGAELCKGLPAYYLIEKQ